MKINSWFKKVLVVGIFCFLLLATTPILIGHKVQKENQILNTSKPDLIIYNADIEQHRYPALYIDTENIGDSAVPTGIEIKNKMKINTLIFNETICSYSKSWHPLNPFEPGERHHNSYMGYFCVDSIPRLNFGYIFFEVDSDNNVDESNEKNNIVFTFILIFVIGWDDHQADAIIYMGELKQLYPSNINILTI